MQHMYNFSGNEDRNELEKNGATTFQEMERTAKEGLLVQDRNIKVQWYNKCSLAVAHFCPYDILLLC